MNRDPKIQKNFVDALASGRVVLVAVHSVDFANAAVAGRDGELAAAKWAGSPRAAQWNI